jgi:hypothetical protein
VCHGGWYCGRRAITQDVAIGVLLCSFMRLMCLLSSSSSALQHVEVAIGVLLCFGMHLMF